MTLKGHSSSVNNLIISNDEKKVISCDDTTIFLWNLVTRK